jgi:hypothetical protein
VTIDPLNTKLLLEKISNTPRLTDRQKTQAMLGVMDRLSFQNPTLNLSEELTTLKNKILD